MSTILTAAGESLIARLQAEGRGLVIDTMILALIPDQDHTRAIEPGVSVPEEALIALRYAIPPEYRAYVNPNQVVYSAMLGSDMGDFSFNWQGLYCSEHDTLVAVATFPALEKRCYDEAVGKTGNNLTRNFLLTFTGARELTGLTISADVWQLDFTIRLNGIDERERLSNYDIYGQAYFEGDGWLLQQTAEAYAFAPGLGYVGGIRAYLAETLPLGAPEVASLPQNVWLDVCLKHSGSDRVAEASPLLASVTTLLADSAADETGLVHYRALVARIEADGAVTDLRPKHLAILAGHEEADPAHPASKISFDNTVAQLAAAPTRVQTAIEALLARVATTEVRGLIELATAAEGAALTDAARAITPSVLGSMVTRSLANVGYQRLPGGLIVQWGNVANVPGGSSATVTLSITFPTAIVLALATPHVSAGTESGQSMSAHCVNTSQISLANTGSLGTNCPAYWMAVGY